MPITALGYAQQKHKINEKEKTSVSMPITALGYAQLYNQTSVLNVYSKWVSMPITALGYAQLNPLLIF